jgi:glycosyltransferase involved in cell wall biosynthesis
VHVGVVFSGLPAVAGGAHTFEQTLLDALRERAPDSAHRFTFYAAGEATAADVVRIPRTPAGRTRRIALRTLRDLQDRADVPRAGFRTFLERSVAERGVELIWFASHHVEECGQPFVCTIWDLAHLTTPWFPEIGADGEWERRQRYFARVLPRAACVIVPNAALTPVLASAFAVGPERVLELPFPTPEFALAPPPPDRDEALLRAHGIEGPYLFYPAQFWPHKNHAGALQALARVNARRDRPLELVLVGADKGGLEHVRELARGLGVDRWTRFLGFVTRDELVALYRRAHGLLYVSFLGPANLPPLEALALGCPVVAADVPGARLQLGDAALLAPPADADAMAACVERLDDEAVRARLIAAGEARARSLRAQEYVGGVLRWIDRFERIRRCWPAPTL